MKSSSPELAVPPAALFYCFDRLLHVIGGCSQTAFHFQFREIQLPAGQKFFHHLLIHHRTVAGVENGEEGASLDRIGEIVVEKLVERILLEPDGGGERRTEKLLRRLPVAALLRPLPLAETERGSERVLHRNFDRRQQPPRRLPFPAERHRIRLAEPQNRIDRRIVPEPGGVGEIPGAVRRPDRGAFPVAVAAELLRPAVFARRPHQAEARRLLLKPAPPGVPAHHPFERRIVESGQIDRSGEDDAEHHPEHRQPERADSAPDQFAPMLQGAAVRTEQFGVGVGETAETERPAATAAGGGGLLLRVDAAEKRVVAREQSGYDLRGAGFRLRPKLRPLRRDLSGMLLHSVTP